MNVLLFVFLFMLHASAQAVELAKHYQSYDADYVGNVYVVPYENNQYLIYFDGFEHEIDGKAHLYEKSNNGIQDNNYVYQMPFLNQTNFHSNNRSTLVHGSIRQYFEIHLANKAMTKVFYYDRVSPKKVRQIKELYLTQQGLLESKVAVKQAIKKATTELANVCGVTLITSIDWSTFVKEQKTTPGMLVGLFDSMKTLCVMDSDYKIAIQAIKKLEVKLAKHSNLPKLSISADTLSIELDKDMSNIPQISYKLLTDLL